MGKEGALPPSAITGKAGEQAAAEYLAQNGYTVLCRNYRAFHGEIDIVAVKKPYIVFAEVKTRTDAPRPRYGRPATAVTEKKRRVLARTAEAYIASHPSDSYYRFDVIEVRLCRDRVTGEGRFEINHMKGAFGAGGKIWI